MHVSVLGLGLALAGLLGAIGQGLFAWIAILIVGILMLVGIQ